MDDLNLPAHIPLNHLDTLPSQRKALLSEIKDSLVEFGAVFVDQSDVASSLVANSFELEKQLFNLSEESKRRYYSDANGGCRGLIPLGRERAGKNIQPDPKEVWHVSREPTMSERFKDFYHENFWPSEIPGFEPTIKSLYQNLDTLAIRLSAIVAEALGLDQKLLGISNEHNSVLRMIKYAPTHLIDGCPFLAGEHKDVDLFTIHFFHSHAGCEFLKDKDWLSYEKSNGSFLLTIGEMLERITNGLVAAPAHRVRNHLKPTEHRYFMGYFVHPNPDAILHCHRYDNDDSKFADIHNLELLEKRAAEINLY